ncbi:MAG TPA: hypothetical protein VF449_11795 [Parvibaculum sp.]
MRTRIIRGFAWLDLAITAPFVVPYLAEALISLIYRIDAALGYDTPLLEFGALQMMFVNIMGVLGVIWALVRLRDPNEELARIDALGRLIVAALIIHAITWGATPLLWAFVATELLGSLAQLRRRTTAQ